MFSLSYTSLRNSVLDRNRLGLIPIAVLIFSARFISFIGVKLSIDSLLSSNIPKNVIVFTFIFSYLIYKRHPKTTLVFYAKLVVLGLKIMLKSFAQLRILAFDFLFTLPSYLAPIPSLCYVPVVACHTLILMLFDVIFKKKGISIDQLSFSFLICQVCLTT